MEKELYKIGLVEAWQAIYKGHFKSEEYTQALVARINSLDKDIAAWAWLDEDRALASARRSDAKEKRGVRFLQGIPLGIKDIFDTRMIPTEMGSPAFAGNIPRQSAPVIKRLESQGGFVLGKTVTTECAFLSPGKTRNPWNLNHTPGGSSSGSAAAVAAGFVPAALGSQTNGSTIRPAAFCGVVGFKPTQGLLTTAGAFTFSHTLDQVGLFTRSVTDASWLAQALIPGKMRPFQEPQNSTLRLALVKTPVWDQAQEYARQHFLINAQDIANGGARVLEVELPEIFDYAHQVIRTIMLAEAAFNLEGLRLTKGHQLSKILTDSLAEGRETAAVVYLQALALRRLIQQELASFLNDYDAVITLPAAGEAPATLTQTGNPSFCSIWNLCGVPAITIPTGFGPAGLPLGLQIVAAWGRDQQLLSVASWIESIFPSSPLWCKP